MKTTISDTANKVFFYLKGNLNSNFSSKMRLQCEVVRKRVDLNSWRWKTSFLVIIKHTHKMPGETVLTSLRISALVNYIWSLQTASIMLNSIVVQYIPLFSGPTLAHPVALHESVSAKLHLKRDVFQWWIHGTAF